MALSLHSLWPLALLAVAPLVWWMRARTLTNFNARQLRLLAAARIVVVALAALALAQPVVERSSGRVSVVFAVDVSDSIAPEWIAGAARWIEEARAGGAAGAQVLAFGAGAAPVAPAALGGGDLPVGRAATDIAAAITSSLPLFEPGTARRLVIMTDGRANAGDLPSALASAQRAGVRIFTVPAAVRPARDAWIETAGAPDEVTSGEPFAVDVTVGSQVEQPAAVEIRQAGRTLARHDVTLGAGSTRFTLAPRVAAAGPQALEVALVAQTDAEPRNNQVRLALVAREKPRVLYIESRAASAGYLTRALEDGGFAVDAGAPGRLPADPRGLDSYDAVVLSDVSRADLDDGRMAALERYVADEGGGLVWAGGEAMYGVEGFSKTILERTLPITFRMKDKPDEFAMVIVLDKSWSMAGQKIELAKEAAVAAVEVLPDRHRIGLIAFNDGMEWVVPLQEASRRDRIVAAIRAVVPSGHTNLFPAVEEAYRALAGSKADIKHVLVLSDGRTYPDEYQALVTKMVGAKMTVSGVALGEDADRELLANLAAWGRGRSYVVDRAAEVPQVFVKETQRAARSTFVEQPFRPAVKKPVEALAGLDLARAPQLAGYARAQAKDTAEVILTAGEDEDPILVRWQYGLGRAVVFTSDVKDRWARDWIAWRGYGKFWTQIVRDVMRREGRSGRDARPTLRVERSGDRARVTVTVLDADGAPRNLAPPRLEITGSGTGASAIETRQVGPGIYEAEAQLAAGDHRIRLLDGPAGQGAAVERVVASGAPRELVFTPPDEDLLKAISRDTGGAYNPLPPEVSAGMGDRVRVEAPLWPWLAGLAAIAWLADLALRRVRLFGDDGEPAGRRT